MKKGKTFQEKQGSGDVRCRDVTKGIAEQLPHPRMEIWQAEGVSINNTEKST